MRRFLKAKDDQPDYEVLKGCLTDKGVVISSPSMMFYSHGKGTLLVRSTKDNLDKIEMLLAEVKAVAKSNQEAKRLHNVEPFSQEHGLLRTEADHFVWEALTASRGHDMVAKVTFGEKGSVVNVDVQMLAPPRPEPVKDRGNPRTPGVRGEKRMGPPEVMPK